MGNRNTDKDQREAELSASVIHDALSSKDAIRALTKLGIRLDRSERPMMTLDEAAIYLGMEKSSLLVLTGKEMIPFYKPNGKMLTFDF